MADFSLSAELRANVANFISGITKSNDVLNKFGSTSEKILGKGGLSKNFKNFASSAGALTAIITAETKALKGLSKAVKEYSEVYRKQLQAETALSVAIKNNPYVSGVASKGLKDFASSLQKVSNYGDEQLLPMMTNLIASGRTEAEVQKIMKTAIDLSATGMMSLDTAVTQLNATFNGNVGRLGQQNAELKNLTKEELEAGAAVDILAKKYEGLGEAVKNSSTQLKNVKGDLQEAIGRFTLPFAEWWNKEWLKVYNDTVNWINKINSTLENAKAGKQVMGDVEDRAKNMMKYYKGAKNVRDVLNDTEFLVKTTKDMTDEQLLVYQEYFKTLNGTTKWQRELNKLVENEIGNRKINAENEAKAAKRKEQQIKKENELKQIISDTEAKIKSQELKWLNIEKITGKQVDDAEKIDFYQKTLLDAITDSNGAIDEQHGLYKKILGLINDLKSKSKDVTDNTDDVDKILEGIEAKIKKQELAWTATEKVTGEQVGDVERIDFYQKMLLDAIVDSNGAIGEQHELYKRILNTMKKIKGESDEKNKNPFKILGEKIREIMSKNFPDLYSKIEDIVKKIKEKIQEIAKYAAILVPAFANTCKGIAKGFATAFQTVGKVVSKAVKGVKNAVSKMYSGIKKLTEFSIDDSLNALLKFEDGILTFVFETLPQMPQFLTQVFGSISIMFRTIEKQTGNMGGIFSQMISMITTNLPGLFESAINITTGVFTQLATAVQANAPEIVNAFGSMFLTVAEALPGIIDNLFATIGSLLSELGKYLTSNKEKFENTLKAIIASIINGLREFVKNGGLKNLLDGLLAVQQAIEEAVVDNIDEIAEFISEALPDIMSFLKDSIISASKTLGELAPTLLKSLGELIGAIFAVAFDPDVIESSFGAIRGIISGLIQAIVAFVTKIIPVLIEALVAAPKFIPELISGILSGIVEGFLTADWLGIVEACFNGLIEGFKDLFGIHSPSTLFEGFGENIIEGLKIGLDGFGDTLETVMKPLVTFVDNLTNMQKIGDGIKKMFEGIAEVVKISGKVTVGVIAAIANAIVDIHNTLRDIIKSITTIKVRTPWKTYEIGGVDIGKVDKIDMSQYTAIMDAMDNQSVSATGASDAKGVLAQAIAAAVGGATESNTYMKGASYGEVIPEALAEARESLRVSAYASGTMSASRGLALVGEAGPELVNFRGGEQVLNNTATQRALNGTNNFNVVFNNTQDTTAFAMMQQLKAYNRQLAINSVI